MEPLDLSRLFYPKPVLETERILMRPLEMQDAEDMFEYHCDPLVTEFVHFHPAKSIEETRRVIESIVAAMEKRVDVVFAIVLKASGRLIGTIDVHTIKPEHRRLELGWMMTRSNWGHGYMFEAVTETIRFCFETLGMHRIEASIESGNVRSERLAERLGMSREGVLRENENSKGKFVNNIIYAITNDR